ncbi:MULTISPECIES: beta-hydroxyacyl-ACP dehydratase [unclassified Streptomyces]|uniref:3-hydroxyacyl-ACP dehydratase FabZ family protein n=2 Tax=Streptomyces TaxID=1883 RepID=UPI0033ED8EEB
MIELDGVRRLLPRRRPMLLVDRVLDVVPGERIVATKAVTCNEPWYARLPEGTPAERLGYPTALVIESWGQAAGILARLSGELPEGIMLLAAMNDVAVHRTVLPGVLLEHRARIVRSLGDHLIFEGESLVDGDAVVSIGRMVMAFRPAGPPLPPCGDGHWDH